MPERIFEPLTGVVDGVNPTFFFSVGYTPGTVVIYLNGQLLVTPAGNPWSESDPTTGEVTITNAKCIPKPGDVIAGEMTDTSPALPETEILELTATIEIEDELNGVIDVETLSGVMAVGDEFSATIDMAEDLTGTTEDPDTLTATIEVC
ncbi:MAG: hypothetical protein V3U85_00230 [Hyphomicrobium sp.]